MDKDLDKVRWKYAKLKGLERHPRKLPKKNVFKSIINRLGPRHTQATSHSSGSGRSSGLA